MFRKYLYSAFLVFFLLCLCPVSKAQVGSVIGSDFEELNQGYLVRKTISIVFDAQLGPPRLLPLGAKVIGFKVKKVPASGTVIGIETPDDNGNTCASCAWDVVKDDNGSIQFTVSSGNWYASPRLDRLPRVIRFTTNQSSGTTVIELEFERYVGGRFINHDLEQQ